MGQKKCHGSRSCGNELTLLFLRKKTFPFPKCLFVTLFFLFALLIFVCFLIVFLFFLVFLLISFQFPNEVFF